MSLSPQARYQQLIDEISDHNRRYYLEGKPIISDWEYDQLFDALRQREQQHPWLISPDSPTQRLIGQVSEGFAKVAHQVPLLSLENSYDAGDLRAFDERVRKVLAKEGISERCYRIEPKFDGISVELIYDQGVLQQAITRWDGFEGEDITQNVSTITSISRVHTPGKLHLRGEIVLAKSALQALNHQRILAGAEPFANTRNAAAGSIKLLDREEVAKRGLSCFVYDLLWSAETVSLEALGLPLLQLPESRKASIEEVIAFCEDPAQKQALDQQDIDFDGLVIKVLARTTAMSTFHLRQLLGQTHHHPRWAMAYKFPAQQASTQILHIDFQVGRSGIITPVAQLSPVQLSGAEISRASLHNFAFIREKEIKQGDWVWVQRSGEVIPYIVGVIKERRNGTEDLIAAPLFCPSCQGAIVQEEMHYYCRNPHCSAQIKEKILHFVRRDCLDIAGIGEGVVEVLMQQGLVKGIEDLYALERPELQIYLRKIPGFAEKKIAEILAGLKASKTQPLWRILHGIGIPNIWVKLAKDLASALEAKQVADLESLLKWLNDRDFLLGIEGIGEKILISFAHFFGNPEVQRMLQTLADLGMQFGTLHAAPQVVSLGSFSLSGSFPLGREEIKARLAEQGWEWKEHPNTTLDFMLIGKDAGQKASLARKRGLKLYEDWGEILQAFPCLQRASATPTRPVTRDVQPSLF